MGQGEGRRGEVPQHIHHFSLREVLCQDKVLTRQLGSEKKRKSLQS